MSGYDSEANVLDHYKGYQPPFQDPTVSQPEREQ